MFFVCNQKTSIFLSTLMLKIYLFLFAATQIRRKDGSAISSIIIRRVSTKHTGTYSCRPANLEPAQIKLHVIRGKFDYHFWASLSIRNLVITRFYHSNSNDHSRCLDPVGRDWQTKVQPKTTKEKFDPVESKQWF